jgi:hypothetical protein
MATLGWVRDETGRLPSAASIRMIGALFIAFVGLMSATAPAWAQFRFGNHRGVYGDVANRIRRNYSAESYLSRPTVSPYLRLADGLGGRQAHPFAYQTEVRPLLEQEQRNTATRRALDQLQTQVTSLGREIESGARDSARPTGHPTRFMNYSRFYPAFRQ